jgi:hypothetical protein
MSFLPLSVAVAAKDLMYSPHKKMAGTKKVTSKCLLGPHHWRGLFSHRTQISSSSLRSASPSAFHFQVLFLQGTGTFRSEKSSMISS